MSPVSSARSEKRSSVESQNAPNGRLQLQLVRHFAVDKVEDVGDDHDDAGQDEVTEPERPGGADVDDDADERERVRVDPQRDAEVDDRAQRKHADGADGAGERPCRPLSLLHRRLGLSRGSS